MCTDSKGAMTTDSSDRDMPILCTVVVDSVQENKRTHAFMRQYKQLHNEKHRIHGESVAIGTASATTL
jgi:hypothetical protein